MFHFESLTHQLPLSHSLSKPTVLTTKSTVRVPVLQTRSLNHRIIFVVAYYTLVLDV